MDKNKIKKFLGIKKEQLILLAVWKRYRMEFSDMNEALEFVEKMITWEEKE